MADVLMPRLSDSMDEGTILRWLKRTGEEVRRGDGLAEIETDKATLTYEAEAEGVLEVVAAEGETLPVGAVIARLAPAPARGANGAPQASSPSPAAAAAAAAAAHPTLSASPTPDAPAPPPPVEPPAPERIMASPLARRIAREQGVQLTGVAGAGPGGRVVGTDVQAASPQPAAVDPEPTAAPEPAPVPEPAAVEPEPP